MNQKESGKAYTLTYLDEPLLGTNAKAGTELVEKVARELGQIKSNLSIIVTHFSDAVRKLDDAEYQKLQMVKGYELQPGICTESNAQEVFASLQKQ